METGQQFERPSPTDENPSTSSDQATESEDQKVSDDDDDRNHKHRKREAEPHSVATDADEQSLRRPNRKRKPLESRQMFLDNESTGLEGSGYSKFEKRRTILPTASQITPDLGSRRRVGPEFRSELCPRFDGTTTGRPLAGKGRGRNSGFWNRQDSRLNSLDSLDFSSQLHPQGPPAHPNLFVGGFPSAERVQTASWGAYGFMHPMGMPGVLQPTVNPLLNMGVPRQRCRDFEEQGFCLRGDMCPMEHGVNRIVVEDVQSLSQFNLPVSLPSSQVAGQAGSGSLPLGLPTTNKPVLLNEGQCTTDDTLPLDGVSPGTGAAEADVYDPDKPLWNNDCPGASSDHLQLPLSNDDDASIWSTNPSGPGSFMLSDGLQTLKQKRITSYSIGSHDNNSSVCGRIRHDTKSDAVRKAKSNTAMSSQLVNNKEGHDEDERENSSVGTQINHGAGKEMCLKTSANPLTKPLSDSFHDGGRTTKRASRTLYIQGIPPKSNRREALLSHFHKFGNIIDIYIPLNSEIAFVQFSKREEAEAALKAPDAVMGNRFIKLWWANRDRIHAEEEGSAHAKFSRLAPSVLPQSSSTEQAVVPSASGTRMPAAGTSVLVTRPSRTSATNAPTTPRPVHKKLDSLELLEELRKKQEMLNKKREEFRRQLDKYEKQTISVKRLESSSEKENKKHKGDNTEVITSRQSKLTMARENQVGESSQKGDSKEIVLLSDLNGNFGALQNASKNDKSDQNEPLRSNSELDSQPNSFTIVPPLPSGFADIAVMRDHFSSYGDIDSVVFEGPELSNNKLARPTIDSSVCISFTAHDSAVRAYTNGRCWEGQSLHFLWKAISDSSNSYHESEIVDPSQCLSSEIKSLPTSASGNSVVTSPRNGESFIDVELTNCTLDNTPKVLPLASCCTPNMSSSEEHPPVSGASLD